MLLETIICLLIICTLIVLMKIVVQPTPSPKLQQEQFITQVRTHLKWGIKTAFLSRKTVFIQYSRSQQLLILKSGATFREQLKVPTGYYLEIPGNELMINQRGYVAPKTIIIRGPNGFKYDFRVQMAWGEIYEN
ncbi:hypothetical protein R4Y45_03315 [Holzapfeliella sp. He02]|uniref:Uncharacterized protein n=1 Tax=Holzapfeliella saturejae TaxID=3082953 RepID=A0ABU8SHU1_9LACO